MRQIVVLSDPERVNFSLLDQLKRMFPECDIRVVFKSDACEASGSKIRLFEKRAETGRPAD